NIPQAGCWICRLQALDVIFEELALKGSTFFDLVLVQELHNAAGGDTSRHPTTSNLRKVRSVADKPLPGVPVCQQNASLGSSELDGLDVFSLEPDGCRPDVAKLRSGGNRHPRNLPDP